MNSYTYTVYKGMLNGQIVYIGTTVQKPADRFRWHKANKKDFQFEIIEQFDNSTDMINLEFKLIKQYNPKFNKIKHRKQNLNVKLDATILQSRINDKEWCQKCLKRRVNIGYTYCYNCS
jgi:hypothetical protein